MPSTNAVSERSFSSLRRVKTYLRSTMTQERLNNCMILSVHKEETDQLELLDIAKDFAFSDHRKDIFEVLTRILDSAHYFRFRADGVL